MKTRIWYCLPIGAVLIGSVVCLRQPILNQLRAGNQSLRQQLEAQAPVPVAEQTPPARSTNPVIALSPVERTELLQLRGQILPLRRELQEMSNHVATLAQPAIQRASKQTKLLPLPEHIDRKAETEVMNAFMLGEPYSNARSFNKALGDYLKAHAGELPDNLAVVETSARSPLPQGVSERFELMRNGRIPEEALSYTLVAREKEPQHLADGRWARSYLRADGGTCTATFESASKPDWKGWERSTETIMKMQAQQK
jgi:hypothetical protein